MSGQLIQYDFIIAGTGISGLMLAYRMCQHDWFKGKKILLIDKEEKNGNDRTWCYWEKGNGEWDQMIHTSWHKVQVVCEDGEILQSTIAPYQYKMLRSSAMYSFLWNEIRQNEKIGQVVANISHIEDTPYGGIVHTSGGSYTGKIVFSSLFPAGKIQEQSAFPYLKQHFIGWFVKTEKPVFDKETVSFMDFSVPQKKNTRFMYILPFSEHEALVEYTLFSENLLAPSEYETEIEHYLQSKNAGHYDIVEKEQGNIPMTCFPFHKLNTNHIFHIGSAGGWTKASTGFTFARICQNSKLLVNHIAQGKSLQSFSTSSRYSFYDQIFIDVLHRKNHLGANIFSRMFRKNTVQQVLTFLDEKGSLSGDVNIIRNSEPRKEFVYSVFTNLGRVFTI